MLPHQLLTAPLFQHCMTKSTHFHLLTPSPFISSGKFANPLFLISPPTIRGRRVREDTKCYTYPNNTHCSVDKSNHKDNRQKCFDNSHKWINSVCRIWKLLNKIKKQIKLFTQFHIKLHTLWLYNSSHKQRFVFTHYNLRGQNSILWQNPNFYEAFWSKIVVRS